jgi:threonine aldolase
MIIDLRSDTVTRPTAGMLETMFNATVGDDVFQEDESVRYLEEKAAALFGMETGLFCPSGTMTNQIAIKALTQPPGALICDETAHVYQYEGGGIAFNAGLSVQLVKGERGILTPQRIEEAIHPNDVHKAETQLVCLENTCNRGGGSTYSIQQMNQIALCCKQSGLKLHLDGARVLNAVVKNQEDPKQYGTIFDTISVCLSKGLGAPVGSVLLGNATTIARARRIRKILGGGMRQAGYLAAAGIYALDNHVDRLREDHELACEIKNALTGLSYVEHIMEVETNIVVFELNKRLTPEQFLGKLQQRGIKAIPFGPQHIRFVTHLDITAEMLNTISSALKEME